MNSIQRNNLERIVSICGGDDLKAVEATVMQPYEYAYKHQQPISAKIFTALNYWFELPEDKLKILIDFFDMYFTIAILLDDTQDASPLRNGIPTAHREFGLASTLNCAYYSWYKALAFLLEIFPDKDRLARAMEIVFKHKATMYRGTGVDAAWRDNLECPTEEEFCDMAREKGSGVIHMCHELLVLHAGSKHPKADLPLYNLIEHFGLYIQVLNDYDNLKNPQINYEKGFCEDITEGKYSLPIIYALEHYKKTNNRALEKILYQRTENIDLKRYALELIEQSGALERTQKVLRRVAGQIEDELKALGGNPMMDPSQANWKTLITISTL